MSHQIWRSNIIFHFFLPWLLLRWQMTKLSNTLSFFELHYGLWQKVSIIKFTDAQSKMLETPNIKIHSTFKKLSLPLTRWKKYLLSNTFRFYDHRNMASKWFLIPLKPNHEWINRYWKQHIEATKFLTSKFKDSFFWCPILLMSWQKLLPV